MVALLSIAVGVAIYWDRVVPFQRPVLVVNNTSVTMRYFLKRLLFSGQTPVSMLHILTREAIIKQVAPDPPYNLHTSEAEIDQALKEMAQGTSATITEPEFTEWYRQQLNDSQFSDAEFRDIVRARRLRQHLHTYLVERLPTMSEPVHLQIADKALETWLKAELPRHQVSYHGFDDGYDSTTNAWVVEQLKKRGRNPKQGHREP